MSDNKPTAEELDALETEIAEKFPSWKFVGIGAGYGDLYFTAERIGTYPDRQAASTARGLLQAIASREAQLPTIKPVRVHTGLSGTNDSQES